MNETTAMVEEEAMVEETKTVPVPAADDGAGADTEMAEETTEEPESPLMVYDQPPLPQRAEILGAIDLLDREIARVEAEAQRVRNETVAHTRGLSLFEGCPSLCPLPCAAVAPVLAANQRHARRVAATYAMHFHDGYKRKNEQVFGDFNEEDNDNDESKCKDEKEKEDWEAECEAAMVRAREPEVLLLRPAAVAMPTEAVATGTVAPPRLAAVARVLGAQRCRERRRDLRVAEQYRAALGVWRRKTLVHYAHTLARMLPGGAARALAHAGTPAQQQKKVFKTRSGKVVGLNDPAAALARCRTVLERMTAEAATNGVTVAFFQHQAAAIPGMVARTAPARVFAFEDRSCRVADPVAQDAAARRRAVWSAADTELFKRKFAQHPKNFAKIAAHIPGKTAEDCVQFFYINKHRLQLKKPQTPQSAPQDTPQDGSHAHEQHTSSSSSSSSDVNAASATTASNSGSSSGSHNKRPRPSESATDAGGSNNSSNSSNNTGQPQAKKAESEVAMVPRKGEWLEDEKQRFYEGMRLYKQDFAQIAKHVRTRSSHQCSNFFITHKRRQQRAKEAAAAAAAAAAGRGDDTPTKSAPPAPKVVKTANGAIIMPCAPEQAPAPVPQAAARGQHEGEAPARGIFDPLGMDVLTADEELAAMDLLAEVGKSWKIFTEVLPALTQAQLRAWYKANNERLQLDKIAIVGKRKRRALAQQLQQQAAAAAAAVAAETKQSTTVPVTQEPATQTSAAPASSAPTLSLLCTTAAVATGTTPASGAPTPPPTFPALAQQQQQAESHETSTAVASASVPSSSVETSPQPPPQQQQEEKQQQQEQQQQQGEKQTVETGQDPLRSLYCLAKLAVFAEAEDADDSQSSQPSK